jgi:hypothetical protein
MFMSSDLSEKYILPVESNADSTVMGFTYTDDGIITGYALTPEVVCVPDKVCIVGDTPSSEPKYLHIWKIGDRAFYAFAWSDVFVINIENGIECIGDYAFSGCSTLETVKLPKNLTEICRYAFADCTNLETMSLPSKLETIGAYAFCGTAIKSLVIPESVTSIESNAFGNCNSLTSITIEGSPDLKVSAFGKCTNLSNITLNLENDINGDAFNNCTNLQYINGKQVVFIDEETGEPYFNPEFEDYILNNFNMADNVGFINTYVKAAAEYIAKQVTADCNTDIEKVKALHDWVCSKVSYDSDNVSLRKNHIDSSIFLGDKTVCDGYARGYNLLLQAVGIESCYVNNTTIHAWNIVKLGNHYFHIDCTWDDDDPEPNYNWFMKSDSEISQTDAHSSWKISQPSLLHNEVSTVPKCEYSMGDVNADGEINESDRELLSDYLLGKSEIDEGDLILSDLNFDGTVDSLDMILLRQTEE